MTYPHRYQTIGWCVLASLALGAFGPATSAHAQTGFEAGARLGYGIPMGKVADDSDLNDGIAGQIPIWIDLGYRVLEQLMVGVYFQYGFGLVGDQIDGCDNDAVDCSTSDIRLGIQAHYHIRPREQLDPWVGLGVGYEWMNLGVEGSGVELSTTTSGFEFLNLQVGLDVAVSRNFKVGPFLSFSLGQYSSVSADCTGGNVVCRGSLGIDGDIDEQALHEWLLIGVRGAYVQ